MVGHTHPALCLGGNAKMCVIVKRHLLFSDILDSFDQIFVSWLGLLIGALGEVSFGSMYVHTYVMSIHNRLFAVKHVFEVNTAVCACACVCVRACVCAQYIYLRMYTEPKITGGHWPFL